MRHTTSWNVKQGRRITLRDIPADTTGVKRDGASNLRWLTFRTMKRKWLLPVGLIALLVIGGGLLWHAGVLHRISNKDHLALRLRGVAGVPLLRHRHHTRLGLQLLVRPRRGSAHAGAPHRARQAREGRPRARERPDRRRCVARRLSFRARDRAVNGAGHRRVLLVPAPPAGHPQSPAV